MDLLITSHRPNLSTSSLKVYLSAVRKLNNDQPPTSVNYLLDVEQILKQIEGKSNNTKKSYFTAVGVALQAAQRKSDKYDKVMKKYEQYNMSYFSVYK